MSESITIPTQEQIVRVLRRHPLIRLREQVLRAFLVGSFAKGCAHPESDVDILLEVVPRDGVDAAQLEEQYRAALRAYFMRHDIRGKNDAVHPQWDGRRVDLYFTYDADLQQTPTLPLAARPAKSARPR